MKLRVYKDNFRITQGSVSGEVNAGAGGMESTTSDKMSDVGIGNLGSGAMITWCKYDMLSAKETINQAGS